MLLSPGNRDEGQYGTYFFQGKLYNKIIKKLSRHSGKKEIAHAH